MQINGVIFPEILPGTKSRTHGIPSIESNNMFFMTQEELIERGILIKTEKPIKTKDIKTSNKRSKTRKKIKPKLTLHQIAKILNSNYAYIGYAKK